MIYFKLLILLNGTALLAIGIREYQIGGEASALAQDVELATIESGKAPENNHI